MKNEFDFWGWFFRGRDGRRCGFLRVFDEWTPVHIILGFLISKIVPLSIYDSASGMLLPLSGALIGLTFAWAGNANALLQTEELDAVTEQSKGSFQRYVFTYQAAILVVLGAIVIWAIASLQVFEATWPGQNSNAYFVIKVALFSYTSLTVRECWHVVLGTHLMLIAKNKIKK